MGTADIPDRSNADDEAEDEAEDDDDDDDDTAATSSPDTAVPQPVAQPHVDVQYVFEWQPSFHVTADKWRPVTSSFATSTPFGNVFTALTDTIETTLDDEQATDPKNQSTPPQASAASRRSPKINE